MTIPNYIYNLFLDDERSPATAFEYTKNPAYIYEDWQVVRSYQEFINVVTKKGLPAKVSFDHDLADEHYQEYRKSRTTKKFDYDAVLEKTGMDCVKWMVNYCIDNGKEFPIWYLHTMNPIGKENMRSYIMSFLKQKDNV